jgi:predicted nucleic acid-binding Zn ribbon protein
MKKLSSIVPEALPREEILRAGRAKKALRQWSEIVGPMLATKSFPDKFEHGTVWVAVSGSAWAQELRMVKGQIMTKLAKLCGDPNLFTDIRFGVRPLPAAEVDEVPDTRNDEHREKIRDLSIQEIKERRLQQLKHEGRA